MQSIRLSPDIEIFFHLFEPHTASTKQVNRPLLVFLHYWGGSSETWDKLTSYESPTSLSHDYLCLTIDLRGSGKSTGPPNVEGYSITPMAFDVVSVLAQLSTTSSSAHLFKDGIVLIGHSMGAKVALATLSHFPDNLLCLVKGVVLVAPAPPTPLVLPPDMRDQQLQAYNNEQSIAWIAKNVLSSDKLLSEDDFSNILRNTLRLSSLAKDGWILHGMQEDISNDLRTFAARPHSKETKFYVLAGEFDVVEQKDRVEEQVVRSLKILGLPVTFAVVKDSKHLIPLENPGSIASVIRGIAN